MCAWLQLKEIAPEFYLPLKHHTSYLYVIWCFLTDKDVRTLLWPCAQSLPF